MNQDLLRQRRNLIAISAALLIFDFAQVEIAKVNVLGTELLVGNVQVLMICAWILWGYFFLRYYQYWLAEREQNIRSSFHKRLDYYARSFTKAQPDRDLYGAVYDDYRIVRTGFISWAYTLRGYDPVEGKHTGGLTTNLPAWRLLLWNLKSAGYVAVQTPHATDHVLPFALGLAAPIVTLCTRWA